MMFRGLLILASCLAMFGCRPRQTMSDYVKTHESARTGVPAALQMEKLFGDADHFITHYNFDSGPKVWNTEVFFGGRYTLTMQVDVEIDYSAHKVKQVGTPKFYLVGTEKVEIEPSGVVVSSFAGDERWFSLKEWNELYKSGGDFTKIGITIRPDPVPDFNKEVAAIRKPRVPIRLVK